MDIPNTAARTGASPSPAPTSKKPLIITISVLVLVVLGLLAWWYLRPTPTPAVFPLIENGAQTWYSLLDGEVSPAAAPESHRAVAESLLQEGEFDAVYAENGDVVTLSPEGLVTFSNDGMRTVLIEREGPDYGSSAVAMDASAAALYNPATNALDIFLLDRTVPGVLTYAGSVEAGDVLYGVGFPSVGRLIVRTSETNFSLYRIDENSIGADGTAAMKGTKTSLLTTPTAHAYSYGSSPTSIGATTQSGRRCTGAQAATLGTASGSGAMPSVQTTVWSYMPTPGNLPANYNNGTYCIQAAVTVTEIEGDGDTEDPGGGNGQEGVFLSPPRAHAQATSWTIAYSAHSGTGVTTSSDYYALTYAAATSATLAASPSSIDSGSAAVLTWSSLNATSCTGTGFSTGGTTSGSVSVSPTTTTTYSVSCTGSETASQSAIVTVLMRPNLVSGAAAPSSATTGTPATLQAAVENTGVASAGASTMQFQRATSAAGAGATTIASDAVGALVAGASEAASATYTFTSGGTFYIRACADSTGAVSESNESDNCSGWSQIVVSGTTAGDPTVDITATPGSITATSGTPVTLAWSSIGAASCTGGGFDTGGATSGSIQVSPDVETTYSISCFASTGGIGGETCTPQEVEYNPTCNANQELYTFTCPDGSYVAFTDVQCTFGRNSGSNFNDFRQKASCVPCSDEGEGMVASDSATVVVDPELPQCDDGLDNDGDTSIDAADGGCDDGNDDDESDDPAISCNLTSSPSPLSGGASATFTWSSTNADQCTGTGFSTGGAEDGTSAPVTIVAGNVYQLQCTASGLDPCVRQLTASSPVANIEAIPDRVESNGSSIVSWSAADVGSCTITRNGSTIGGPTVGPTIATTTSTQTLITTQAIFRITCDGGAASDTAIVNVVPKFEEF